MIATRTLETAQFRLARYYLDRLRAAETVYQHGHEHSTDALALFDHEWSHIKQWRAWVAIRTSDDGACADLCIGYTQAGEEILHLRLTPRERLKWLETGLLAAKSLDDAKSETIHLYLIAVAYNDCGEFQRAEDYALQAFTRAQMTDDPLNMGRSSKLLGNIHRMIGNFATARANFEQSLAVFQTLGDQRQVGKVLCGLGLVAWQVGDWEGARKLLTESLAIAKESGQEIDICDVLLDLSLPTSVLGDTKTARMLLEECITRCRSIAYHRVLASSINTLGQHDYIEGNLPDALAHFQEAIAICRKTGTNWGLTSYLSNAASTLFELGKYAEALEYTGEALALARANGQRKQIASTLSNQVEIYLELGELELSRRSLHKALEIVSEIDNPILKLHMLITAMRLWKRLGRVEQAVEWAGLMLSLPICASQERDHIQKFCAGVEAELGLSTFTAAIERGQTLRLNSEVEQILRELSRQ